MKIQVIDWRCLSPEFKPHKDAQKGKDGAWYFHLSNLDDLQKLIDNHDVMFRQGKNRDGSEFKYMALDKKGYRFTQR